MKTLTTLFISLIFFFPTKENKLNMEMYYYLIPETETDCTNDFHLDYLTFLNKLVVLENMQQLVN